MSPSENQQVITDDFEAAVKALHRKGVRLWAENGALRYRAPKGAITPDDLAILRRLGTTTLSLSAAWRDERLLQPIPGRAPLKVAPMSFNQLSHWHLRGMAEHRPIRQVASVIRIRGPLQEAIMKEAIAVVIARHDSLRTNIIHRDGEIMQQVAESDNSNLRMVDLTYIPQRERDKEMRRQIVSTIVDVADYSIDPLFKSALLKLEDTESVLILAMDHMVSDGASRSILEREIFTAYDQLVGGREVSLPSVQMQYADHAIWQRNMLLEYFKAAESQSRAWRRTRFPADMPEQGGRGLGQISFTLSQRDRQTLQEFARRKGTTLVMVILTAYVALVMRWCGVFDTLIQVMSNGRTSRLIENTVGYVAYPLYLHISVHRGATFADLLEDVTTEYCRACERPDFYYSYTLSPVPEFTRNTCFNWIPRAGGTGNAELVATARVNNMSYVIFDNPVLESLDDLDMEPSVGFEDMGNQITGGVGFARRRFTSGTMTRFVKNLGVFLDTISVSPGKRIREIAIT
jgi:hypothetical protein